MYYFWYEIELIKYFFNDNFYYLFYSLILKSDSSIDLFN